MRAAGRGQIDALVRVVGWDIVESFSGSISRTAGADGTDPLRVGSGHIRGLKP